MILALTWLLFSPLWLYAFIELKDTVMENRAYVTLLGIAALAAWAAERAPVPVFLLVVLYAIRTVQRNRVWRSPMAFSACAFSESPKNGRAQLNYATALQAAGMNKLAAEQYGKLIQSGSPQGGQAAANMASMRLIEGRVKETIAILPHAIEAWPGTVDLHINLGCAHAMNGDTVAAALQFKLACLLQPNHPSALRNLAACQRALGMEEESRENAEKAKKLDGRELVVR